MADSEDCATFAYISVRCLETEKINVEWRNTIPLLETAVMYLLEKSSNVHNGFAA